jgi:uncharacterized membrane protein
VLAAVHYPIVGDEPQWSLAAALAIAGAIFGPWTAGMIGISTPSRRLERFAPAIGQGQILLMVDVPAWRVQEIEARLEGRATEEYALQSFLCESSASSAPLR